MKYSNLDNADEIMRLYESGISSSELAHIFGISRTTIPKMYKRKYGLKTMLPSQGNVRYFQNIDTKLKAYFLGFIAADGCITTNNTFAINIVADDRIVLDKLKEEIGFEHKIYYIVKKKGRRQVGIRISNKLLADDLRAIGLEARKSLTMGNIIPNIPKEFRNSFILGYLDGDGWVSNYKKVKCDTTHKGKKYTYYYENRYMICTVGFCGTKEFLYGIVDEINPKIFRIKFNRSIHRLELSSAKLEIYKYYKYLYNDQPFYLKRKHDKFIEYLTFKELI